jgi:hypothetical protein
MTWAITCRSAIGSWRRLTSRDGSTSDYKQALHVDRFQAVVATIQCNIATCAR